MQQQSQEKENLVNYVSDIAVYLGTNTDLIPAVEDLIIQAEQNKIINGGV